MYNSYFGFREAPFSVTPDPHFFYSNPTYREAFAALLYGIKAKKGFIVMTGEVGTGKTTLLRKLMRNLEATIQSVFIFNTYLVFPQLLQLILHDLGLTHKRKSTLTMIQELNDYLIQQVQKGHIVSLLIDEAQNLSDDTLESLRLLSNLETDKEKLLQIVLIGQPELEKRLDQPKLRQLKQRMAFQCRLARLKDDEVGPFIEFRLRAAGYEGHELFHPDAIPQIALYSKGIPRLINIMCDNALLIAYAGSQKRVPADIIKEVASDLRLGLKAETVEVKATTAEVAPRIGKDKDRQALADEAHQGQPRRLARVGVGTFLVLLLLGSVAFVIDSPHTKDYLSALSLKLETLRSIAGTHLEGLAYNLYEWLGAHVPDGAVPGKVQGHRESEAGVKVDTSLQGQGGLNLNTEPVRLANQTQPAPSPHLYEGKEPGKQEGLSSLDSYQKIAGKWKDRPMVVPYGSTIFRIAGDVYGANRILGMDLIKEFNPQINNLNWVFAGQGLSLPPLTRETLLRRQPDGSYRLIVASFSSLLGADEFAKLARYQGYEVIITRQPVSDNLSLHRVEIGGLQNPQAVNQAWDIALRNHWISFDDQLGGKGR